ncbi:MAG: SH3 domain-containing protein [Cellvibrionaceae bacterium]|nr:SH3 domain-containing protein [Cellvibrionaceae bacterium]
MLIWLSACLTISLGSHAKAPISLVVTSGFINMHTGPNRGAPIFHVLEKEERLRLIKMKTSWIKVATQKGIEGWVHRRDMVNTRGIHGERVNLGIPGREDFAERQGEIGFAVGQLDSAPSLGLYGAWRFSDQLSAELRFSQATGNFSNSQFIAWGLLHQPFPEWRLSPFFKLASGQVNISPNTSLTQSQDRNDNFFMVGTGVYYYLAHRFMLRLEYNDYTTLPDRDTNENVSEWGLGLSAFF